jgi:hypothetical protein
LVTRDIASCSGFVTSFSSSKSSVIGASVIGACVIDACGIGGCAIAGWGSGGGALGGCAEIVCATGGIVTVRDGGAVEIRTFGGGGILIVLMPCCVPLGTRAGGGSGATSPAARTGGTVAVIRGGLICLVARRGAGLSENIKSSEGSGGSGFCVATSSMSSLTAVDSVFFSAIGRGELTMETMYSSEILRR